MTHESRRQCTFVVCFHFTQPEATSSIGMIAVMIAVIHSLAIQRDDAFMVNNEVAATHFNPLVIATVIAFAYLHKALFGSSKIFVFVAR